MESKARKLRFTRHIAYCILCCMRLTISLPDQLAHKFLATVPSRQRSATIARLLAYELARCEQSIEAACHAANADEALSAEIDEWQAFDDVLDDAGTS